MTTKRVVRITAVPRHGFPNSGLLATRFAREFGDEIWVIPGAGEPLVPHRRLRLTLLDRSSVKHMIGVKVVRYLALLSITARALIAQRALFFVHSFVFAIPLWALRKRYCIFIHGSDRRYLASAWGRCIARHAEKVFGIGFGMNERGVVVQEVPNLFHETPCTAAPIGSYDIVFVLRNAAVKNPTYPVALAEQLGVRGFSIGVIGVDESELPETEQRRLAAACAAGAKVDYLGRRSYEDVISTMAASKVLLIPSHSEGIPKVLLEAACQGLRVVVNSALALPRSLTELVAVCDLKDWDAIANHVLRERTVTSIERLARSSAAKAYLRASERVLHDVQLQVYQSLSRAEAPNVR